MAIAIVTTRFTFSSPPLIADLDRVCEPNPFGRKRPKMHESRRISRLPPGGYHRSFADRVFTNWSFADRKFANWPRLYNGLRTREVRRNGCSHQGQRCSPNDREFQHRISCCPLAPSGFTTNPNHRYEAISRAQTSDSHGRFFDGCCGNGTRFRGLGSRVSSRYCSSPSSLLQKINGKIRPVRAM
jgi:hypothetical protein